MLQWLQSGAADDQHAGGSSVNAVHAPFAILSAPAYVITRVQLHAAFSIFFQAQYTVDQWRRRCRGESKIEGGNCPPQKEQ